MIKNQKFTPCIRLFSNLFLSPKVDKAPVLAYVRWLFLEGPVGIMATSDVINLQEICCNCDNIYQRIIWLE